MVQTQDAGKTTAEMPGFPEAEISRERNLWQ
jgi:hypothetical protein